MKPTVKVIMLHDAKGAPDSVTSRVYKQGETYDVPEDLAECFFSAGHADPAEAHDPAPDTGAGGEGEPDGEAPAADTKTKASTTPRAPRKARG